MSAIFISHSSRDNAIAGEFKARLAGQGHHSVFLDFDPDDGIPAGRNWEGELYVKLRTCQALIVLCSEHTMASPWCFAEITQAKSMGKHIFPVKVAACQVLPLLSDVQFTDLTRNQDEGYQRLWSGLKQVGLDPAELFNWDGTRSPYPGLLAFQEQDAAVYFGRGKHIQKTMEALNRLRNHTDSDDSRLALILGASGSGKSSLVRAGVVPRLKRDKDRWLVLEPFRPLGQPFDKLAMVLASAFRAFGKPFDLKSIRNALEPVGTASRPQLMELVNELRVMAGRREATVLLVIDQLEELLGGDANASAIQFFHLLKAVLSQPNTPFLAVATLRSDFLGAFQIHEAIQGLAYEPILLPQMALGDFGRVIEGPAKVAGLEVEAGLAQAMVADTATDDALPLLAFTLRELSDHCVSGGCLTLADYRDRLGGLQGSLARAAESIFAERTLPEDAGLHLHRAFLALVQVDEEGRYVRRPARWDELPGDVHKLLERFVQARLLVSRGDGAERFLEVAHEALFRSWGRLSAWLNADREFLLWRRRLGGDIVKWELTKKDESALLRGSVLTEAERWQVERPDDLNPSEREFIGASAAMREHEWAARELAQRRNRRIALGVIVALSLAALFAGWQWRQAEIERNVAEARSLASQSALAFTQGIGHYELSTLLAIESMRREPLFENHSALRRAVSRLPVLRLETGATVQEVAFSADGRHLVAKSENDDGAYDTGSVRVFEMETGKEKAHIDFQRSKDAIALNPNGRYVAMANAGKVHVFELPLLEEVSAVDGEDPVLSLLFDPTGRALAIGLDKAVRIVDPASGKDLASLQHQGGITPVTFSPRGQYLAAKENLTVWVFAAATGKEVSRLVHEQPITAVAFSPIQDGGYMATGSGLRGDAVERFFSTATGREISKPVRHQDNILTLNFSPDMVTAATGSLDHNLRLWDIKYQMQKQATVTHRGSVNAVAFSPDGQLIATGSGTRGGASGGNVRVFAVHTGKELGDFEPGGETWTVSFSSDGRYLAAGENRDALVYDAASVQRSLRLASENVTKVVAFGPDAGRLAALAIDDAVSVVETATGKEQARFTPEAPASTLAFSPDGRFLAMAGNKQILIHEAATGKNLLRINHDGDVRALAFTPDGHRLAAGIDNYTDKNKKAIYLWDAATGKESTRLVQDDTIYSIAFGPGGRLIAVGTDKDFRVLEAETGKERMRIAQNGEVDAIALSPDGGKIAIGNQWDDAVRMFDLVTAKELLRLTPDDEIFLYGVDAISFSPDGRYLDIAQGLTKDRVMLLPDDLIEEACSRLTRNLSFDEWKQYFGSPYQKTCANRPCPSDLKTDANGSCVAQ